MSAPKKVTEKRCEMGYLHPVPHRYEADRYWVPAIHGGYFSEECKTCGQPRRLTFHTNWNDLT